VSSKRVDRVQLNVTISSELMDEIKEDAQQRGIALKDLVERRLSGSSPMIPNLSLSNVTLPDAIAAMVEAWYEAQNVDTEPEPALGKDLIECIDYILNQTVKPELLNGFGNLGTNPTIKKLLLIRHDQGLRSKSNAGAALYRCGILYRGSQESHLRIYNKAVVLDGLDETTEYRYGNSLLDAPGAKFHKDKLSTGGKDYSYLEIPSKYLIDKCSL